MRIFYTINDNDFIVCKHTEYGFDCLLQNLKIMQLMNTG
ncbi:hypothetical protein CoNPh17_CDS0137 [Staphylococcus phage S-CoN_Ph17]|nr:hypothetical protein CoNPh17_CDS0137 [Staphylococcus phage S-CoN_Ph17]